MFPYHARNLADHERHLPNSPTCINMGTSHVLLEVTQGLQIVLMSGVTVTSASQILESFWNIWSQVSQRKKPFSGFPARGPGMFTLS